jgi:hypothetical protein
MSEQLKNLYSTTVASGGYTAGAGSLNVSSASGAPSGGTFSLTILDASTGDVLLIFRVTSLAGTAFAGASEGPDANAPAGAIVIGTVLTAAAITQLFADHASAGGFIQPLTALVPGSFSQLNFSPSAVTTTQFNGTSPVDFTTIRQQDPTHTGDTAALVKNIIASTFTVTVALSIAGDTNCSPIAGLFLSNGSGGGIFFGIYNWNSQIVYAFTSLTNSGSGGGTVINDTNNTGKFPLYWLRIQETASARNYYVSPDGVTFALVYTESNTAHITTSGYGFGVFVYSAGRTNDIAITCYSFTETTP